MPKLERKLTEHSLFRWGLVGFCTAVIDYLFFIYFYKLADSVFLANFCSSGIATLFNYFSHHKWTFRSDQIHSKSGLRYSLNLVFWWVCSTSIIKGAIILGIDPKIAKLIPLVFVAIINYFILNNFVYKRVK
jgi:putative flippase GtrA